MHLRLLLMTPALLFPLTACSADAPPSETKAQPVSGTDHALASRATTRTALECGGRTFVMPSRGEAVHVQSSQQASVPLPVPDGMQDFAPVGMGCAVSNSGARYLVVQYGEVPFGCKVCEWFFIYDAQGAPMNGAVPPTRGSGETLEANNDGYERLLSELGLRHPDIEYPAPEPR